MRQPAALVERLSREPAVELLRGLAERGFLQCLERGEPAAIRLQAFAKLVKLRYFAGLTIPQAAAHLGIAPRTADAWWSYAKAWFQAALYDS